MSLDARLIRAMLDRLPPDEKLVALIVSVIERKPQAMRALVSLSAVLAVMARASCLSDVNRMALAEIVRDTADQIERGREVVQA